MVYLLHLTPAGSSRSWRVLSDRLDRDAAVSEAIEYLRAEIGHSGPVACSGVERAGYAPLGDPEFMPAHDLYTGHTADEASDVGALTMTVRMDDTVVATLPDGSTIKVQLVDVIRKGEWPRVMLRVEAPKEIRVRSMKTAEVPA